MIDFFLQRKKRRRAEGEDAMDIDDSSQSSDLHVTVMETATGKTLSGDDAPLASEVESWLDSHPGWEVVGFLNFKILQCSIDKPFINSLFFFLG